MTTLERYKEICRKNIHEAMEKNQTAGFEMLAADPNVTENQLAFVNNEMLMFFSQASRLAYLEEYGGSK